MNKLLMLSVALVGLGSSVANANENFTHIGSFKSKGLGTLSDFDEFNYFVSTTAGEWTTARSDCAAQLGGDLVSFNTREEAEWIATQLDQYGSAVNYWTAGQVQTKDFTFWATNGQLLPIWLNWAPGHPPANSSPLLRVKLHHINKFYNFFEVDSNTKALRYICKR